MTHELMEYDPKHACRVQGSRPIASDSSTDYIKPSPDSGETTTIESLEVQTPVDSSQPSTSGVKEGEISLRPMTCTFKGLDVRRVKPEDVREWYDFRALASVHTMSPSFLKISKLLKWISGAVFDSWQNNPYLKRGDVLEIKFVSVAPETARKGSHLTFNFMKLQRPDAICCMLGSGITIYALAVKN
ncbi:UNVERIFIED_CONTAM: hypothetical protein Sindi_2281400 [Sesamum indicum]